MIQNFPVSFVLKDGTTVIVHEGNMGSYDFHLTRLNSEKHNFIWIEGDGDGTIEESYETRFDRLQNEAVAIFRNLLSSTANSKQSF